MSEEQSRAGMEQERVSPAQDSTVAPESAAALELSPGRVIAERFRVMEVLGRGGMGVVYRVMHITLNREFALKTLDGHEIKDVTWLRFQQEAKATSMLNHPNLISVHDYGLIDGKLPYFVMDLVSGTTLAKKIAEEGPLSVDKALPIMIQVCFGLAYAHELGIVHRDLKPSNIMLIKQPGDAAMTVRIVDFGIAKLHATEGEDVQGLTRTGEIFGSPLYMSPEQCLGVKVDHRSDIYALGCVFFEALTGLPPFMGGTALSTMMKHQSEKPPTLKEATLGKEFPAEIQLIVSRLLEKEPDQRYQSVNALTRDLSLIQQGISNQALTQSLSAPLASQTKGSKEFALLATVVGLLFAVLVGTIVWFVKDQSDAQQYAKSLANEVEAMTARYTDRQLTSNVSVQTSIITTNTGKKVRRFNFIQHIGTFNIVGTSDTKEAYGIFEIPVENSIHLRIKNIDVVKSPDFFLQFQTDDVTEITASNNPFASDELFKNVGNLRGTTYVDLTGTAISDKVFSYLNELPALQVLVLNFTSVTEDGICALRRLESLSVLSLAEIRSVTKVLRKIRDSEKLQRLILRSAELTDEDIQNIATLKNAVELNVSNCKGFTDASVDLLLPMTSLHTLIVPGTTITAKCLPTFNKFKNLKTVNLSKEVCTKEALVNLKRICPNIEFRSAN